MCCRCCCCPYCCMHPDMWRLIYKLLQKLLQREQRQQERLAAKATKGTGTGGSAKLQLSATFIAAHSAVGAQPSRTAAGSTAAGSTGAAQAQQPVVAGAAQQQPGAGAAPVGQQLSPSAAQTAADNQQLVNAINQLAQADPQALAKWAASEKQAAAPASDPEAKEVVAAAEQLAGAAAKAAAGARATAAGRFPKLRRMLGLE